MTELDITPIIIATANLLTPCAGSQDLIDVFIVSDSLIHITRTDGTSFLVGLTVEQSGIEGR